MRIFVLRSIGLLLALDLCGYYYFVSCMAAIDMIWGSFF